MNFFKKDSALFSAAKSWLLVSLVSEQQFSLVDGN